MVLSVTNGLVLHLETDYGVTTVDGTVTFWRDRSASGNHLSGAADPALVANLTPGGMPAIVLDGTGDRLERLAGLTGLPAANADRTMLFLVRHLDHEGVSSGLVYGEGKKNQAFGLVSDWNDGTLALQGWGTGSDFDSGVPAAAQGWMVHSVVLSGGSYSHFVNGTLIASGTHNFATSVTKLLIGAEIAGLGEASMEVGAALIYNRALSASERLSVTDYLNQKYLVHDGDNAPIAVGDAVQIAPGGTAVINILANDIDEGPLTGASVTIVTGPARGTITAINPVTGAVTYANGGSGSSDSFTYRITDATGKVSHEATVTIDVTTAGPFSLEGFEDQLVLNRASYGSSSASFLPISMAFLPDNRMLLLSKNGEIRIVDPETGSNEVFMKLQNIDAGQERGLLDITLDPDFATNGHFYLYYTPASPGHARIARFTMAENAGGLTSRGLLASETVIWQDTDGYLACCHFGGGLDFGPDGKLWLTTADKFQATTPGEGPAGGVDIMLDLTSSSGKIIRINKDGTIPDGTDGWPSNPFIDGPGGNDDSIWAYGLRNPFRARWDFQYGQMYIGEVGGNQQAIAHDDLHTTSLAQRGAFYGWPFYEGTPNTYVNNNQSPASPADFPAPDNDLADAAAGDFYSAPIWSLAHKGQSASLTGGVVYRGTMFPSEWNGVYFYGDYTRDYIRYLRLDETGTQVLGDYAFKPSSVLPGTTNEIVSIEVGRDGALYYAMIASGEVRRIVFNPGDAPVIQDAQVVPSEGPLPLSVTFTFTVSDPNGDPLTWVLNFGDGTSAQGSVGPGGIITVNHDYTVDGTFLASLSVSDGTHTAFSNALQIRAGDVNEAPTIQNAGADSNFVGTGDPVTFSALVADLDGDMLTWTWHFGDGTSTSGTIGAGGTVTATHAYIAEGAFQAYLEVTDGRETVFSPNLPVQVGTPSQVPVTQGLSLLLQSDIKIGLAQGNTVAAWLDGSGNGNNLFAQGDPQLVANQTPTGQAAIVFDGTGDLLQRVNATDQIFNFATGAADRTIFIVVKYDNPEGVTAGVVYGDGARNEAFGLAAKPGTGQLMVHGWGNANDFPAASIGVGQGWMVQSVVLKQNVTYHYKNGVLIDSDAHVFNTDLKKIVLGAEIAGLGESQLSLAAVLVYNRALTESERAQVESFLDTKYISGEPGGNQPPVAQNDSAGTTAGSPVSIGVLANDSDPDGGILAITAIGTPLHGTAVLDDNGTPGTADDRILYTPAAGFSGQDSFTYTISDGQGGSATATVTVTVAPPGGGLVTQGLVAQYEADANVSLATGNTVAGWLDGSGRGNDLVAKGDPTLVSGATPTGQNAIAFDGVGDLLERVHATDSLNGLPTGAADRTMFLVVRYLDAEGVTAGLVYGEGKKNKAFGLATHHQTNDLMVQGWGAKNDFPTATDGPDQGWMVQSVVLKQNVTYHYKDGVLIDSDAHAFATALKKLVLGAEIAGLGEAKLEIAGAFIYDRALTEAERLQVEDYLQAKYITGGGGAPANTPPEAGDDAFTVIRNRDATFTAATLLANDTDADGDALAITGVGAAVNGTVTLNADGSVGFRPDAAFTGTASFAYTVSDGRGGEDTATVTLEVRAPTAIGVTQGLVLRLEATNGVAAGADGTVTLWEDMTSRGNHLAAQGDPRLVAGATPTGRPALALDGTDDLLVRVHATDPVRGLPNRDKDRTLFFVVEYLEAEDGPAGFSYGTARPNQTLGLAVGPDGDLLLRGNGAADRDADVAGIGRGWTVQSVVISEGSFAHYADGALIDSGSHLFDTRIRSLLVGGDPAGGEGAMNVAAALAYNRALSEAERIQVETYLAEKYVDELVF